MTMTTANGFTVETVSTIDRGAYFIVKTPNHLAVPLDAWNPHSPDEIRTFEQLAAVLTRVGEDAATLKEET
jgi:hypothetical protein